MGLHPADEECRGALFEVGNTNPFRKKVIAVQLDEGIEIDGQKGKPAKENELVGEIMNPIAHPGIHPHDHRQAAQDHLGP